MIRRGYHSRVNLGCNIRAGSLDSERFALMKRAGFRFVLMGLESASQCTLNRLKKGIRVGDIETTCAAAKWAGLEPHVTIMLGYPWETRQEVGETLALAKSLLRRGLIDSLQATVLIPYPGTALFEEARTEGWLRAGDWDSYDMKEPVLRAPLSRGDILECTRSIYRASMNPRFVFHKLISVRTWADIRFLLRAGVKVVAHVADFGTNSDMGRSHEPIN